MTIRKCLQFFGLLFSCAILSVSCSDNDDNNRLPGGETIIPNFSQKVKGSVHGFVTDERDEPVAWAVVKSGDKSTMTNERGYFEITDASVPKDMGVVTVETSGYFKGIRTWVASANSEEFVRIQLIPKTVQGTFSAAQGGDVELSNGLKLSFPVDAVVNDATGQPYSGNVNVAMYWISPTGENFSLEMPGDLSAINEDGYLRNLVSYGMVAAELTGDGNQKLQIADGKKVSFSAPIEQELRSSAPETMPLWLFDEENGIWLERGEAQRDGDKYIGDFDHFSYWNLDIPYTPHTIVVKYVDGNNPLVNQYVFLEGDLGGGRKYRFSAYTNAEGVATIRAFARTSASVILYSSSDKNCVLHSDDISIPNNGGTTDLGTKFITLLNGNYKISGTVKGCDGQPLSKGYVIYKIGTRNGVTPVINGNYEFFSYLCPSSVLPSLTTTIQAFDSELLSSSDLIEETISGTNHVVSPISACGNSVDIYVRYEIDGHRYTIIGGEALSLYSIYRHVTGVFERETTVSLSYYANRLDLLGETLQINFDWKEPFALTVGTFPLASFHVGYEEGLFSLPDNDSGASGSVTLTKNWQSGYNYDIKGTFEVKGAVLIQDVSTANPKRVDVKGEFVYKGAGIIEEVTYP